ncbi:MAG: hypothetical protein JXA73_04095 [Acidobacteria bacterium]|nr:hypothetical protein [Acidobacteriota bacterium]
MQKSTQSYFSIFLCFLVLSFFTFGCRLQDDHEPTGIKTLASGLGSLAPEGWKLYDTVSRFTPRNLYEKINGRAEFYLAYDMVDMTFAGFENGKDASRFVDISIYDMGTPTHAFGVFSAEKSQEGQSLKLGRDAYRNGANYFVWKGRYYIQIISSDTAEDLQKMGMDLAHRTAALVSDSGESVWGLDALPAENRVPGSERYFLVDAMGLAFMKDTYMAQYRIKGTTVSVFLSRRGSPAEAAKAIAGWLEHANRYGKDVKQSTIEGMDLTSYAMGKNYDVFFKKGRLIAGVSAAEDRKIALEASVDLWKKLPEQ